MNNENQNIETGEVVANQGMAKNVCEDEEHEELR